MRAFLSMVLFLAAALIAAAALAYPAWWLVGFVSDQPIHRVMHRVAMLVAFIGLIFIFKRWDVANKDALGYGAPQREFLRQLLIGLLVGAAIMLPLIVTLFGLDVRALKPEFSWNAGKLATLVASGLLTGLVVALIEETFFRGALFTAVRRESGTALAIVLPSLLYASVHFLGGRLHLPREAVQWSTGFEVLSKLLEKYTAPLELFDSFAALFAVGVLLSVVRIRTQGIAACIGLHAAWVCTIKTVGAASTVDAGTPAGWIVGTYDGVIGWGALGWITLMLLVYAGATRRKIENDNS
jgi:membrane protease YdiL (CAAX protease family)